MANFRYHRPSDRITAGSWSLSTGTARTGYDVTNLDDGDPSNPFWANETSIRLVRDFGSATQVDNVYLFAHTFANSANLHLQMHTANSWGAPDVDIAITIPSPYEDGFTYHLHVDVSAAYPTAANRTKRYLSIVNESANGVTCAIGEVWMVGSSRTLVRNVSWGFTQPRQRITSNNTSKRGVKTYYDLGSIEGGLGMDVNAVESDFADIRSLEADAKGSFRSFPVVLSPADSVTRRAEPMLVRLVNSVAGAPQGFPSYIPVHLNLEICGQGELLGA